jgi:GNAT superfamily N-acetyltransferase
MEAARTTQPPSGPDIAWLCVRHRRYRGPSRIATLCAGALDFASRRTDRVRGWRWIRFRIDLENAARDFHGLRLTRIDDRVLAELRAHPDAADPTCASGLRFHDLGMHDGFVWFEHGNPLCSMWLLTQADNEALAAMPDWSDMYPPLPAGIGQIEKIWTYTNARQRGIATRFAYAMFDEARRHGLRALNVHIADFNTPALRWAQRTGWVPAGTIVRYHLDLPGIRRILPTVAIHSADRPPSNYPPSTRSTRSRIASASTVAPTVDNN